MIKKKSYDGVVVAAHYSPYGRIEWVRAFERHGFVFSDRIIMDRQRLVEQLRSGKRFKTGERIVYLGSDFKIDADIRLIENNGESIIVAGETQANQDSLGDLPVV